MTQRKDPIGAILLMFTIAALTSATALAHAPTDGDMPSEQPNSQGEAAEKLTAWPAGPRLAGHEMLAKYGPPDEITDDRMIWHEAGPFKRILLTREERPHHFPIVHMDYLQHTISYDVPSEKAGELLAFDGAISIYRVGGELSARCDLESNNVLTLNLAHDIIEGNKTVEQARKEFGEAVMARTTGKDPAITAELQFETQTPKAAADTDTVSIPGAPRPSAEKGESVGADAETLALLIASDMDKVHAAMIAKSKNIDDSILDYAQMMHESHGKHIKATVDIGMNSKVTPIVTGNVGALHDKNAAALSKIVPLDGDAFEAAYIDFVIEAGSDAQNMIDERLAMTKSEAIRNHLSETRQTITKHLEQAKDLQEGATRTASL